jgi:hypothetical protein
MFHTGCREGEEPVPYFSRRLVLKRLQIRSTWLPGLDTCNVPNAEIEKLSVIIMFTIDISLVLIMFLGLLRFRNPSGGIFELARLLWKQVRRSQPLVALVLSII